MSEPSLLRWAGSKRASLHHLLQYWRSSDKNHYVEPFCGSAALFFATGASQATLSDKNKWLISFLRSVAMSPEEVFSSSSSIPRTREAYLKVRSSSTTDGTIESAAQFVYLNRNCFNGIFRTNKLGRFNVPFSDRRTGDHPSLQTFLLASDRLRGANIISGDFDLIARQFARRNSFVYLDPPYATRNARVFTQYDSHSFGIQDIERLNNLLDHLENLGSRFLVSYADVPEIKNLSKRWRAHKIEVQRHVSGFTAFRRSASELLISNF